MADLDYGHEITIETPGTSDPAATPTNQWQRKQSGGAWVDIAGETGETYTVVAGDRNNQIRLVQNFGGAEAPSNGLQVTSDEFDLADGLGQFGNLSGNKKWAGGVLAPNGKIYGIPGHSTTVLEIDPVNQTTSTFGSLSGTNKWFGGVLAPNGKIYGIPHASKTVLEIDPVNQTATTFGSLSGSYNCYGGVLAPNGKIYGIPLNSATVLEIDPVNRTTITFGSLLANYQWDGGVLAPNGKIYGIPYSSSTVLEIDPVNQTTTTFGSSSGSYKWFGGVLAPNGKIYGIPHASTTVLEMDFGFPAATGTPGSENWELSGLPGDILDPRSAYFNKF